MTFEHFALNVPDARAHAHWYVENLGFRVARKRDDAPYTHFLADDSGRVVVELYTNPAALMTDFKSADPLTFHVAVVARDARHERQRLQAAGATPLTEETLPDGSVLIMMRDPWGVPLQLCQRTKPLS